MYLDSFTYTHDKVGNRLSKAEPTTTTDYGYDRVYRLLSATPRKPGGERYGYDPVGNRLSGPQAQQAYQYNEGNQLLAKSAEHGKAPNAGIFYTFDNNGNLIGKEERNGSGRAQTVTSYSYDYENRLTGVEIEQGQHRTIVTFSYDPFGRRLSKVVEREANGNGQNGHGCDDRRPAPRVTRYLYDNEDIVLEYDDRGEILARYLHGPGIDEPLAMKRKNTLYYYHADGLGSITALTDQDGYVVRKYDYDSFGAMKPEQRQTGQPYTYTAREWDRETGLYYYRARYYDPEAGRFISKDPIGFKGGINVFSYVKNNPINFYDPYGLLDVPRGLLGELLSELVGSAFDKTYSSITGAACASRYCKRHSQPHSRMSAYSECQAIFEKYKLPMGNSPFTFSDDFVYSCADECIRITNTRKFSKQCCN